MSELLPCPFCGDPMEDRGYGAVHTGNPKCPIASYAIDIGAWNVRTDASSQAEIERLRAALETMRDLVIRAQFNTPEVYQNWHSDARTALGTKP